MKPFLVNPPTLPVAATVQQRKHRRLSMAVCCALAVSILLPTAARAGDAFRFVVPQAWAVGASNSTYQEWDRFTSTSNNAPDIGTLAVPAANSSPRLSALPPGALSGTGNFYAFAGNYAFRVEVFNNATTAGPGWGTHVIVQTAATLGSGDAVLDGTMMIVDTNGAPIAGGAAASALRHDVIVQDQVSGGPAGTVTQREELWELFLPGHTGDFRVQASLKQHSSLRQVRVDTQQAPQARPLIRIPILHPETTFVDFTNDGAAPTALGDFGPGLHLITARFGDNGSNNDDGDVFTFRVPAGYQLTGLRVLGYSTNGNNGNGSFFAIADGTRIGTSVPTATNHLSNKLIAGAGDLLGPLAQSAYFGTTRLVPGQPLPAGNYTIFLHETSAEIDLALAVIIAREPLQFQLLTWNDSNATTELPSAVGRKPSPPMPTAGDWLVFTADDAPPVAANNPAGAVSHNLVDITGAGGPGYNLAPSLSGTLSLRLESVSGRNWQAAVTSLACSGQANAVQTMNQFLVTPESSAATNAAFNVDGAGNYGQWSAASSNNWAIQYTLDFYFATSADGDPSPADIDATFNDKAQTGLLIPVNQLTSNGLAAVNLDDPLGFHTGDFEAYLLEQIKPRLPGNATYLLITQMGKTRPGYTELGLPITTNSLIGNTTIAYTTQTLAATSQAPSMRFESGKPVVRFQAVAGQTHVLQRSTNLIDWETVANPALTYPTAGAAEWIDSIPASEQQFYRILEVTP